MDIILNATLLNNTIAEAISELTAKQSFISSYLSDYFLNSGMGGDFDQLYDEVYELTYPIYLKEIEDGTFSAIDRDVFSCKFNDVFYNFCISHDITFDEFMLSEFMHSFEDLMYDQVQGVFEMFLDCVDYKFEEESNNVYDNK